MSAHEQAAHHARGDLVNPDVHHEESDINLGALLWFVAMLTATVIAVDIVCWGMFKAMNRYETANEPYVTPLAAPAGQQPPEPRLQTTPWTDLTKLHAEQQEYMNSYGWVDERMGIARVPIAKAKEMLLKQGIPVRPELADATEGTHIQATGESNGGRSLPAAQPDKSKATTPAPVKPGGGDD